MPNQPEIMSRSSATTSNPLAGRYLLGDVIGRGGMGVVYRATDRVLKRTVAVKVLSPALAAQDSTHVLRFEREARAAAALSSPAVVRVFDAGADDDARFIVMEYVPGRSLSAIVRDRGPLEPHVAASIGADVAAALAAAHARGIVHRDVKPSNVIVTDDGAAKVLDFGLARTLDATAVTRTATVLGSAAYMSPEQVEGQPAEARSDIYSLGCLLYEMLTGRPPFTAEAVAAILNQHVSAHAPPPSQTNRQVPRALDALVMQMLEKAPAARPTSAADVRARLCEAESHDTREAPRMAAATPPTARLAKTPPTRAAKPRETAITPALPAASGARRKRYAWLAAALAGVIALTLTVLATSGGSRDRAHSTRGVTLGTKAATTRLRSTRARKAPAPAQASTPPALTVAGLAGGLIALVGKDAAARQIQQPAAQQLTTQISDMLNSYYKGNATDASHKLSQLSGKFAMLEQHGLIAPGAAAAIGADLTQLAQRLPAVAAPPAGAGAPDGGRPPHDHHKPQAASAGHDGPAKDKAAKHD
jgi:predicted Ser/Thr protein kinase